MARSKSVPSTFPIAMVKNSLNQMITSLTVQALRLRRSIWRQGGGDRDSDACLWISPGDLTTSERPAHEPQTVQGGGS